MPNLQDRLTLPAFEAANRVFMAPMTRMRAPEPADAPTELHQEYYRQRAGAGLMVTEGTQISLEGKGYSGAPGIYTDEQVAAWRKVTDTVHEAGGRIAVQLWHVGRITHPDVHGGEPGVSASALPFRGRTNIKDADGNVISVSAPIPRELRVDEVPRLLEDYRRATRNARAAGFDMVEIHGANGYLLQQFMSISSNVREDRYGGSLENRARLPLEVVDAVIGEWDAAHVGMRLSPMIKFEGLDDADGKEMGVYMAGQLADRGVGYFHLCEPDWAGGPSLDDEFRTALRDQFPGIIIVAGNYDADKAARVLEAGWADAIAFGRPFIANPDLPERLATGAELNSVDFDRVYGGDAAGYTDYPVLQPTH